MVARPGGDRARRSRGRPGALSRVGGGTAELSSNHETAERLQNAHAYGQNTVWQSATVRNILTNRVYAGQARYNYRQPVIPQYRKTAEHHLGHSRRGAVIVRKANGFERSPGHYYRRVVWKAQRQLQRNAATARKRYQPASGRYLLRTLVKCGACGLGMGESDNCGPAPSPTISITSAPGTRR